jgi:cytochrome c oxidase subunit I+III
VTEAAARPPVIDVSELPTVAFGRRSPIWWGVVLLIAIETSTLAVLFLAYLYVRGNFEFWPPSTRIDPLPGALCAGTLVASLVPMWFCRKAALEMNRRRTRRWLLVGTVVSAIAVPLRVWQIDALPFPWDENAYASIVWTTIGMHCIEGAAGVLENILLTYLLYRGPLEKKHFEDVETNAVFWAFVVLVWVPFAVLFGIDGAVR